MTAGHDQVLSCCAIRIFGLFYTAPLQTVQFFALLNVLIIFIGHMMDPYKYKCIHPPVKEQLPVHQKPIPGNLI